MCCNEWICDATASADRETMRKACVASLDATVNKRLQPILVGTHICDATASAERKTKRKACVASLDATVKCVLIWTWICDATAAAEQKTMQKACVASLDATVNKRLQSILVGTQICMAIRNDQLDF